MRSAPILFVVAVSASAFPIGSVSGHCGPVPISVAVSPPATYGEIHCNENTVAFWNLDQPYLAELGGFEEDSNGNPAGSGDVELTVLTDAKYRFRPDWTGYFAVCFTVSTTSYGDGSATASKTLGPWVSGEPCELSRAIPVTKNKVILFTSSTYLHVEGGGYAVLSGGDALWNWDGQRVGGSYELSPIVDGTPEPSPVPEPSTRLPMLLTLLPAAVLCVRDRYPRPRR